MNRNEYLDQFYSLCRQKGLKVTPQRTAVYTALMDSTEHPTADMIHQAVKNDFPGLSLDTVNRTLATFSKIGIVDVLESHGLPRRFEPDLKSHHHFFCLNCGKIADVTSDVLDHLPVPEQLKNDFVVIGKRVVFRGYCKECNQASSIP